MSLDHHLYGMTSDYQWLPVRVNATGYVAMIEEAEDAGTDFVLVPWVYAAASGGITNTSAVELVAAAGADMRSHVASLQAINVSGTATEVLVKSDGITLWRARLQASMTSPRAFRFRNALRGGVNASITVECGTTGTQTYVNAQGWSESSTEDALVWGVDDLVWGALNELTWG